MLPALYITSPPRSFSRIFPPPSQSYYCLLKVNSSDEGDSEQLRQYLVCFLSIGKEGLDLYPYSCYF